MARIVTAIRAAAARTLVLGLALFMTLQGAMACFTSAHATPRCHDQAAWVVQAEPDASAHLNAGHSHDNTESADHRHDTPDPIDGIDREAAFDCCGWMCTVAIFQAGLETLPHFPQNRLGRFWHRAPPPGWLALGLDRPPRSHRLQTI